MTIIRCAYDMRFSPAQYDFLSFLMAAEVTRGKYGADAIDLSILPGPEGGFREGGLPRPMKVQTFWNVMLPAIHMVPSITTFNIGGHGEYHWPIENGHTVPQHGLSIMVKCAEESRLLRPKFRCPSWALDYMREIWPENAVSITVRDSPWQLSRNMAVPDEVYDCIRDHGYEPVVIPDTFSIAREYPCQVNRDASINICLRMAAYELSALNLFSTNGPMTLALFSDVPFIWFLVHDLPADEGGMIRTVSSEFYGKCGLPPGSQWPGARDGQRIHYGEYNAEAVTHMLEQSIAA